MVTKKQTRNREFKRVRLEGGSVVITLGSVVPSDWQMVKVVPVGKVAGKSVTIRFDKVA